MPSNPIPATALALLVLTACATPAAPPAAPSARSTSTAAKSPPAPKVVCDEEMETGSHISRRHCRPVEGSEQSRAAAQADLSRQRPAPPPPGN